MIDRYTRPEMAEVWSTRRKLDVWQQVEALALDAWAIEEVVPTEAGDSVRSAPPVDIDRWLEREATTHHDVAAFVDVLADSMADHHEWLHYGLTSSDVLDTATGALIAEAGSLVIAANTQLFEVVKKRSLEHRNTVMVGRTHGIWAEPTSFGLKLASWAFEIERNHRRLIEAVAEASVGKISGAVGTYAHVPPSIEAFVCERLGIGVEPASTQVVARDRHAALVTTLAVAGASLERFAVEIRHLQRSEVGEAQESFRSGQKGSSAMPHKRNPIRSENVTGMARLLRGYATAALENVALWHERDISHSSVERVILPDAFAILHFATHRMASVIDTLIVDRARMTTNLEATRGLVFSQAVLLALIEESGLSRDDAYRIVQRHAAAVWDEGGDLRTAIEADPDVSLSKELIDRCFDPMRFLENADGVFARLEATNVS